MKNLNSFAFIQKAIEHEANRQIALVASGGKVVQETRRWDQASGKSFAMRTKEDAHDYRYFPDPDLMPIVISAERIARLTGELPQLPDARKAHYIHHYGLGAYDAEQLVSSRAVADFFEKAVPGCNNIKVLANLVTTEVFRWLGDLEEEVEALRVSPEDMRDLVNRIEDETIHLGIGKKVLSAMWQGGGHPDQIIDAQDLRQINDAALLEPVIREVLSQNDTAAQQYRAGKEKAFQALVGQVMAKTKGKANPKQVHELLERTLKG